MEYAIGVLITLLIGLFYERSKRKSAESLLENSETLKKNLNIDKDITKNKGLDEAETVKRDQIKKEMEEKVNEAVSVTDIINFFTKRK